MRKLKDNLVTKSEKREGPLSLRARMLELIEVLSSSISHVVKIGRQLALVSLAASIGEIVMDIALVESV